MFNLNGAKRDATHVQKVKITKLVRQNECS